MAQRKYSPWAGLRGERIGAPEDSTHSRIIPTGGVAGARRSRDATGKATKEIDWPPMGDGHPSTPAPVHTGRRSLAVGR